MSTVVCVFLVWVKLLFLHNSTTYLTWFILIHNWDIYHVLHKTQIAQLNYKAKFYKHASASIDNVQHYSCCKLGCTLTIYQILENGASNFTLNECPLCCQVLSRWTFTLLHTWTSLSNTGINGSTTYSRKTPYRWTVDGRTICWIY